MEKQMVCKETGAQEIIHSFTQHVLLKDYCVNMGNVVMNKTKSLPLEAYPVVEKAENK